MEPTTPPAPVPTGPVALAPPSIATGLPLAAEATPERADAARNRLRILRAAARLITELGAEHVTMEAVAAAAGVGKGTVFRRFGDRTGLMLALLDHSEQEYQLAFMYGPAPLGPGAPPRERLLAFGAATLRHELDHRELFLAAERAASSRYATSPRMVRATHVLMLLRAAQAPGDTELLAEVLLGYLDTALVNYLHTQRGMSLQRLRSGWDDLITRLVPDNPDVSAVQGS